jgi:hypothetical protein
MIVVVLLGIFYNRHLISVTPKGPNQPGHNKEMKGACSMGDAHSPIAKQANYRPGDAVPSSNIFHPSLNIFQKYTVNKYVINCFSVPTQRTQLSTLPLFFSNIATAWIFPL